MFSPKFQWFGWALKIPAPTKGLQMSALHYSPNHDRIRSTLVLDILYPAWDKLGVGK